jgi:hypothetical protein
MSAALLAGYPDLAVSPPIQPTRPWPAAIGVTLVNLGPQSLGEIPAGSRALDQISGASTLLAPVMRSAQVASKRGVPAIGDLASWLLASASRSAAEWVAMALPPMVMRPAEVVRMDRFSAAGN